MLLRLLMPVCVHRNTEHGTTTEHSTTCGPRACTHCSNTTQAGTQTVRCRNMAAFFCRTHQATRRSSASGWTALLLSCIAFSCSNLQGLHAS